MDFPFVDLDSSELVSLASDTNMIEKGRFLYAKIILMMNVMAEIMREIIHKAIPNLYCFLKTELQHLRGEDWAKDLVTRCEKLQNEGKYLTPELFRLSHLDLLIRHIAKSKNVRAMRYVRFPKLVMNAIDQLREKNIRLMINHETGQLDKYQYKYERDGIKGITLRLQTFLGVSGYEKRLDSINSTTRFQEVADDIITETSQVCKAIEILGGKLCPGLRGNLHEDWQKGKIFTIEEEDRMKERERLSAVTDSKTIGETKFFYMKIVLMVQFLAVIERRMIRKLIPDLDDFFNKNEMDIRKYEWAKGFRLRCIELQNENKRLISEQFDLSDLYSIIRIGVNKNIITEFKQPSWGWGKYPKLPSLDTVADDVERVRGKRNVLVGHHLTGELEKVGYEKEREEIKTIIKRLENYLNAKNEYVTEIEDIDAAGIHNEKKVKEIVHRFQYVCTTTMVQGGTLSAALHTYLKCMQDTLEDLQRHKRELTSHEKALQEEETRLKQKIKELEEKELSKNRDLEGAKQENKDSREKLEEKDRKINDLNEKIKSLEAVLVLMQPPNRSFATAFGEGATAGAQIGFLGGIGGGILGGLDYVFNK